MVALSFLLGASMVAGSLGRRGQRVVGTVSQGVGGGGGGRLAAAVAASAAVGGQHAGPEVRVPSGVLGQVVGAHEALAAQRAGELLLARVRPEVTRQLVGAREPLAAFRPGAREWTLACVRA